MEGAFEQRGLKVNLEKTKLLVTGGERGKVVQVGSVEPVLPLEWW